MIDRIKIAQQKLSKTKLDGLLVSSAYNIAYLTGFFGFSKTEREGYLLVTHNQLYFFASGLNNEAVSNYVKSLCVNVTHTRCDIASHIGTYGKITLIEISPRTPLTKKALATIIRKEKIKRLGFEKHHLTFAEYERLNNDLKVVLVPTEYFIEVLRMIKTNDELSAIEIACALGDKTFDYISGRIKQPGITEKELAFEIEYFIRKRGGEISFSSIVAFGPNSSIPHHQSTHNTKLITNNIVLLDFGVKIDNYCSDMTRTVFFGKASKAQKRMYQTVLESQNRTIEFLNHKSSIINQKGIRARDVDKVTRSYIASQRFPTIPHSLGHGIGLEVHEPPSLSPKSKAVLKPGMLFSIEPGIYLSGVGGVRIEDLVVLEPSGPRFLTKASRELIEL